MNQKCALCKSLLKGEVVSIMNGFKWFGITNTPREIGRSIERSFGVKVSRVKKNSTTRYGEPSYYFEYRLNRIPMNATGIAKMEAYVNQIEGKPFAPKVKCGRKTVTPKLSISNNPLFK